MNNMILPASVFLGQEAVYWAGVEAIAVVAYTIVVLLSIWLIYRQVRIGVKSFQLAAIRNLQELIDDSRENRTELFETFPPALILSQDQFPLIPPGRHKARPVTKEECLRIALTHEQVTAVEALGSERRKHARQLIGRLNDIGQLVEDGFFDRRVFLGKYHVLVIQCCHVLEAVRRNEEQQRSGNYGQRLLRMRQWAINYNDVWPKHRAVPISIPRNLNPIMVYRSPPQTVRRLIVWKIRGWLDWYD